MNRKGKKEFDKKIIIYAVIGLILVILVLISFGVLSINKSSNTGASNSAVTNVGPNNNSQIPQKCRLPEGQDLESWKEHLSHHSDLKECFQYFQ